MNDSPRSAKPSQDSPATVKIVKTLPARGRRREFTVMVVDEEVARPSGFGLMPDRVLDDEVASFRAMIAGRNYELDPTPGHDDPRDSDDHVIWEGGRVLAVLRVDPSGRDVEVTRFDGPAAD